MAVVPVGTQTVSHNAAATTWSGTLPASLSTGELLVVTIYARSSAATAPTGNSHSFLPILTTVGTSAAVASIFSYYKIATAGDVAGATVNFTGASSTINTVVMQRFTGHDPDNPINVAAGQSSATNTAPIAFPSVTTTVDGCLLYDFGGNTDTETTTVSSWDSGQTQMYVSGGGSGNSARVVYAGYMMAPSAGTQAASAATYSDADASTTQTIAIAPTPLPTQDVAIKLQSTLKHLVGVAVVSAQGQERYDSTREILRHYDSVREKSISEMGFMPYAYAIGGGPTLVTTTNIQLAAGGDTVAFAIALEGHMLLQSYTWWDTKTNGVNTGPLYFALWEDRNNNSNTLNIISGSEATQAVYGDTGAAKLRTVALDTSPPLYLSPGCYWMTVKNDHASNTNTIGGAAAGTMSVNINQQKVLPAGAYSSPLDFVAATWTKMVNLPGVRLNGRSFGQTTDF